MLLPSQAFEFLRDEAPGFLLAGLESIRAVRVGPHPIGLGRQQFPPKFFPAQAPTPPHRAIIRPVQVSVLVICSFCITFQ